MATRHVKELLQAEIITALGTTPAADELANAYTSDYWDKQEGIDPANFPCAVVMMPVEESSQSLSETMSRLNMGITLDLRFSDANPRDADVDCSKFLSVIRRSLAAYWSTNLRRMGMHPNSFTVAEKGWGTYGQDVTYQVKISVPLVVPTTQEIDDGL